MTREVRELNAKDEDVSLSGAFIFIRSLLEKFPQLRMNFPDKNKLLMYLIHEGLFLKETKGHMIARDRAMPPKCKNIQTRDNCLKLINMLCVDNASGV